MMVMKDAPRLASDALDNFSIHGRNMDPWGIIHGRTLKRKIFSRKKLAPITELSLWMNLWDGEGLEL